MRIRAMDEDTQAYDATLESIKGDIYDLTGVSVMQDADTYKSTYDVLKDISEVWDKLQTKNVLEHWKHCSVKDKQTLVRQLFKISAKQKKL